MLTTGAEGSRVCAHPGWRFGRGCYAMEVIAAGGPRHDLARFGTKRASAIPPTHHGEPDLRVGWLLGLALCRYMLRLEPVASQDPDQLIAGIAETI